MWGRIVAGALIIVGAEGIGMAYCQEMKCKLHHQTKQKHMLLYIEREIDFLHRPMLEIFENISERLGNPYGDFLMEVVDKMKKNRGKTLYNAWNESIEWLVENKKLKKDYFEYLYKIGNCFGCEEDELQISMLKLVNSDLEEEIEALKGNMGEREKLIKTLSLLAGVFCVVMFI